ncbi:alpha-1,4-glucan--maltose-1-phosphate maltosyltransferase [Cutibacterium equinum]|uniref:alpha-1,4-glucan--maltose-1-phosphate maltosyltransferase n=1 Tax=Cutibacterium equinum TaxID=3016342 RepID=UPI0038CD154C
MSANALAGETSQQEADTPSPRRAAEHADDEALVSATSAIDVPGCPPLRGFGRIPVHNVHPEVEGGQLPIYSVVDEEFEVTANVFREGHDAVGASVVLTDPDGNRHVTDMHQVDPWGLDIWTARVSAGTEGDWTMHVEGWSDTWGTWHHNADAKLAAGIDIELVCAEGHALISEAITHAEHAGDADAVVALREADASLTPDRAPDSLRQVINTFAFSQAMRIHAPRPLTSPTTPAPLRVERRRALYGSWYEFFPRSQGAHIGEDGHWVSGTFDSSWQRLDAAAAMGFDVVYLPPIHPIGTTFRKGKDNTLTPGPDDPGSPWAIGSAAGGHDAIHPDLGTFEDFDRFVAHAHELGMEVALDFALQASPDHPWVTEHPEWFTTRVDGTIAYAENPPKKYQDIYPINFDNDPEGIYHECLRLLELWISHGVTIFRVDNPHTKPLNFWAWLLEQVHRRHPEVIFLAEAFTRPEMMGALGKVGFQQGYSYFTWRTAKWELEEYLDEVSHQSAHFYRPNFFTNTPDINPIYLNDGNPAGFAIRAILAATMSPSWGMYSGFEICEHEPLPGREEYAHSEKYEYRPRDFDSESNITLLVTRLNEIRRAHPALQQLRDTTIHHAPHDNVFVFSKKAGDDVVIVIVSLDPVWGVESQIMLDMAALGLGDEDTFEVHDELTGADFTWGQEAFVRLYPAQPAHILHVRKTTS